MLIMLFSSTIHRIGIYICTTLRFHVFAQITVCVSSVLATEMMSNDHENFYGEGCFTDKDLPHVSVNNLVCTWYIGRKDIDLEYISQMAPFMTYDPHRFAAAICHMQNPKATCLLFNTGRGVCAGTKSMESAFYAVNQLISMIQRAGVFYGRVREFKVRNLVASSKCPFTVDLQRMASSISSHCTYHAGLFPGLRFKPGIDGNKRQALLIYRNGGTVITGNSSTQECNKLWAKVYGIICRYKTNMPVGAENSADYRIRMKIKDCQTEKGEIERKRDTTSNFCCDGEGTRDTEGADGDHATNTFRRKGVIHISERCRMISSEIMIRQNGAKRQADFSVLSLYEREVKRCRHSVCGNLSLLENRSVHVGTEPFVAH